MLTINFNEEELGAFIEKKVTEALSKSTGDDMLCSIQALADFLHMSKPTACRLKLENKIPFWMVKRKVYFSKIEVMKALQNADFAKKPRQKKPVSENSIK
jgi:hypothetical protein